MSHSTRLLQAIFLPLILGIAACGNPPRVSGVAGASPFGALLALLIFRMPLDVYGFVGLILLVGIVKKNAIMATLRIALGQGAGARFNEEDRRKDSRAAGCNAQAKRALIV